MNIIIKFCTIAVMSAFAFAGMYWLKVTLNKLIPPDSSTHEVLRSMPYIIFEAKFWLAGLCYVLAMGVYLFLLQGDMASKIFPLAIGVNILLTTIGATLLLGDVITLPHMIGIGFIMIGIFLIHAYAQ